MTLCQINQDKIKILRGPVSSVSSDTGSKILPNPVQLLIYKSDGEKSMCYPQDALHGIPGYLFLLFFVFIIVVVLMNLLNGLAVSDTGSNIKSTDMTWVNLF